MKNTKLNNQPFDDIKLYFFSENYDFEKIIQFDSVEQVKIHFNSILKDVLPEILHTSLYFQPKKKNIEKEINYLLKLISNYKFTKNHIAMKFELLGETEDKENEEAILAPLVEEIKMTFEKIYKKYYFLKTLTNFIKYANREDKNLDSFFAITTFILFNHNQTIKEDGTILSDFDTMENEVKQLYSLSKSEEFKEKILKLIKLLKNKKVKLQKWYKSKNDFVKC